MNDNKDVYILGIETSCDETSAAVVRNGRRFFQCYILHDKPPPEIWGGST
jgi:N6-L-threonylcarbamoyladenine synthase